MKNRLELRAEMVRLIKDLREGVIDAKQAREINKATKNVLVAEQLSINQYAAKGEKPPHNSFLEVKE